MFNTTAYIAIDQVLMAEKQLISTFVTYEPWAEILNKFADTKAEFAQHATKQSIDALTELVSRFVPKA